MCVTSLLKQTNFCHLPTMADDREKQENSSQCNYYSIHDCWPIRCAGLFRLLVTPNYSSLPYAQMALLVHGSYVPPPPFNVRNWSISSDRLACDLLLSFSRRWAPHNQGICSTQPRYLVNWFNSWILFSFLWKSL